MLRVYNRQIPAPLPFHKMLTLPANPTVPLLVDLRQWAGPIKDQGSEGSCTGHAFSSAREWIARKYYNKPVILSPQFMYAEALIAQGNFPQDSGSDGTTLCETIIAKGCCELSLFPYTAGQITRPTPEQEANGALYTLGRYHGLAGSSVAVGVLGNPVPWPVEVGFTVYESFESQEVADTGIMPVPKPGERVLGGHEVLCLGYDLAKQLFLIQNSWGTGWGQQGFFWMPSAIFDAPDTDLKVVHSGKSW